MSVKKYNPEIIVITRGDPCNHLYELKSRYYAMSGKAFLSAIFQCRRCGKKRPFAVAMNGAWFEKILAQGETYA